MQLSCLYKLDVELCSSKLVSTRVKTTPTVIRPKIEAAKPNQGVLFKNATPTKKSRIQSQHQQAKAIPKLSSAKPKTRLRIGPWSIGDKNKEILFKLMP